MNPEKRELYTITWSQLYTPKPEPAEDVVEKLLEHSEFKEANDLINRIKRLDK